MYFSFFIGSFLAALDSSNGHALVEKREIQNSSRKSRTVA